jgi:hypothetical protein
VGEGFPAGSGSLLILPGKPERREVSRPNSSRFPVRICTSPEAVNPILGSFIYNFREDQNNFKVLEIFPPR